MGGWGGAWEGFVGGVARGYRLEEHGTAAERLNLFLGAPRDPLLFFLRVPLFSTRGENENNSIN